MDLHDQTPKADMAKLKLWNRWHALFLLACAAPLLSHMNESWLLFTGSFSFLILLLVFRKEIANKRNWANWLTILRLIIILIIGFGHRYFDDQMLFPMLCAIIILDGIDGQVARYFKSTSSMSNYLDLEVGAFFVAVWSSLLYLHGYVDSWILVVGFMRYSTVMVVYFLGWENYREPRTRFARTAVGFLSLSLISPLVFEASTYMPILIAATIFITLAYSQTFALMAKEAAQLATFKGDK